MLVAQYQYQNQNYTFDLTKPFDISLPIHEGSENPNCYYAENPVFEIIAADNFVGSVQKGGSCNYQKITLTPHGNGTHTECYGHISADTNATIYNCLKEYFALAQLVTLSPKQEAHGANQDFVILLEDLQKKIQKPYTQALVIRTLPNNDDKKIRKYSNTNPPYLQEGVGAFLAENNIVHLLIDTPSVDKEIDAGALQTHRTFWQTHTPSQIRRNATITELIFVPNILEDGIYLLNLQVISLQTDASPSKPILYPVLRTNIP